MTDYPKESDGWVPPATYGGKWCRMSPEGVYEIWPLPKLSFDIVYSGGITSLLGTTVSTSFIRKD